MQSCPKISEIRRAVAATLLPPIYMKKALQIGNYCYLIAATEMLLSASMFVQFIFWYIQRDPLKWPERRGDVGAACKIIGRYIQGATATREQCAEYYMALENVVLEALGVPGRGEMEDVNVVFLYFQRSYLYLALFSAMECIPRGAQPQSIPRAMHAVYIFHEHGRRLVDLSAFDTAGVMAIVIHDRAHYEIYRRKNHSHEHGFDAINTNLLLPCTPRAIIVFIKL